MLCPVECPGGNVARAPEQGSPSPGCRGGGTGTLAFRAPGEPGYDQVLFLSGDSRHLGVGFPLGLEVPLPVAGGM